VALFALTLIIFGLLVAACGVDAGARRDSALMPPRAFADDFAAELASDGRDSLWLLVTGYEGGRFAAKVFQAEDGGWKELPAPAREVGNEGAVNIALARLSGAEEAPCVSFGEADTGKPRITCWVDGEWQPQRLPSLVRGARLVQVEYGVGYLTALFQGDLPSGRFVLQVMRLDASGWQAVGPRIKVPAALAHLGSEYPEGSGSPLIGIETQSGSPERYVVALRKQNWVRLGPTIGGPGLGPQLGGPVVSGRSILVPVNDAEKTPWSFSVLSFPAAPSAAAAQADVVSIDSGNAQGKIDEVGDSRAAWATWREDDPLPSGAFRTKIYAASLGARGQIKRKLRLWNGISIGPGSTQVIEFRGQLLALYMPSTPNKGHGLRTMIRAIAAG